jgi:hypothetical protein
MCPRVVIVGEHGCYTVPGYNHPNDDTQNFNRKNRDDGTDRNDT